MASDTEPKSNDDISTPADAPPAVETSVEKVHSSPEQLPQSVDERATDLSDDATPKTSDTLSPKDAGQLQETIKALEIEVEELKAKLKYARPHNVEVWH
jgi:polyhydroxyalkanoate synthesis regulator phasin